VAGEIITTELAPRPDAPLSQAVRVGQLVFVSGLTPFTREIETVVRMKITNEATVSLCSSVVAPRAPKAVWVLPPPKTERSAPLPCWSRTTRIRNTQTRTCMTYNR